jgi:hypothetical protein
MLLSVEHLISLGVDRPSIIDHVTDREIIGCTVAHMIDLKDAI